MQNHELNSPPQWALRFLRWFCRQDILEDLEGDLTELYFLKNQSLSKTKSNWWFVFNVMVLFRPGIVKPLFGHTQSNLNIMLKYNIKISVRNLLKNKGFSFINISGLAIGIASCLLIAIYVHHEYSFDQYHSKKDRIFRAKHYYHFESQGDEPLQPNPEDFWIWGNAPLGAALLSEFPQVEKVAQFSGRKSWLWEYKDTKIQEDNIFFADSSVFEIFDWPLIYGDAKTALSGIDKVVLTESTARKYFGNADPLGKIMKVDNSDDVVVAGVMKDLPENSHFKFDILISMDSFRDVRPEIFGFWGYVDFYTYFLLKDPGDIATIREKTPAMIKKLKNDEFGYLLDYESLNDAYLNSEAVRQPGETGNENNLYIFSVIAIFILLIACINFTNLSTARSLERAREVGVRKSLGASRSGLVNQFLIDAIFQSLLALIVGVLLVVILQPFFEQLTGKVFDLSLFLNLKTLGIILSLWLLTGLMAGSYPAMILSGFDPVKVLKGKLTSTSHGSFMRKGLVIFQFCLSVSLIAGTAIVFSQMDFMLNADRGYDHEQVLVIDFSFDNSVQRKIETIKTELAQHPAVSDIASARTMPGGHYPGAYTQVENEDGTLQPANPSLYEVDVDYIDFFNMEMAAGRPYSRDFPADSINAMVINEAAAKEYGYADPEKIIGKRFEQWGREGEIVGVVKDFNFQSLHHKVQPLTLRFAPFYSLSFLALKVNSDNLSLTISELEEDWQRLVPHRPFLYEFMDDGFNQQYESDLRFGKVFAIFALLAIFIACLGLFGLASYATRLRTKEIGIRKVLGASVTSIVGLISSSFLKLVLIAIALSIPLTWFAMNKWLQVFAYQVEVGPTIYVLSGVVAILIALFTIGGLSLKAAYANPVDSIAEE